MQLFYDATLTPADTLFSFDKEESKHIIKVLRKKDGDILHVTNGLGYLFTTQITLASEKNCTVKITAIALQEPLNYQLHLAVAPTKMNDRFEWFLEKATEIGIAEITPVLCDHAERKHINLERLEKVIVSAMKQSNQCYLPKIHPFTPFTAFVKAERTGQLFVAHCEETERASLKEKLILNQQTTILIGPEGDFSSAEIQLALQQKYQPVTLGSTRLRTETAALAACHSVAFIHQ
ncbi:MAG: 16S rRNA (uracil(1498)-N(3))-methyltransferase [Flavobacterium sp.]|nr:16S rRNA (uracil(1498)-N(3))-methyltransferase [Flavobacterium sp.]